MSSNIEFVFPVYRHIIPDFLGGDQYLFKFDNGLGASVIRHRGSYGFDQGLWEIALIRWTDNEFELDYNDYWPDVKGWQNESDINQNLRLISSYTD